MDHFPRQLSVMCKLYDLILVITSQIEQDIRIELTYPVWKTGILTVVLILHNSTQMCDEQVHLGIRLGHTDSNRNRLSQSQAY